MTPPVCQVFDIVRGSSHDGPGMRTTVFLKGCPLRCSWCQNPEGVHREREILWESAKCIRCLECVRACPANALSESAQYTRQNTPAEAGTPNGSVLLSRQDKPVVIANFKRPDPQGLTRDPSLCRQCGACVAACPARAMDYSGREWTLDALLAEALKDQEYYRVSGGGVTVSGGEPLGQAEFLAVFFCRLHELSVHTALDTCGLAPKAAFAAVLAHTDHVLFDLKLMDPVRHEQYTGQSNRHILENLLSVAEAIRTARTVRSSQPGRMMKLWIRTPLIPGATATAENLAAIGVFIRDHLADVTDRWELCAFNNACRAKYRKLGLTWAFDAAPLMDRETVEALKNAALATGFAREKLVVSGLIARSREGSAPS